MLSPSLLSFHFISYCFRLKDGIFEITFDNPNLLMFRRLGGVFRSIADGSHVGNMVSSTLARSLGRVR